MAQDVLDRFIRGMEDLGFQGEDIVAVVAENIRKKDGEKGSSKLENILEVHDVTKNIDPSMLSEESPLI